MSGRATRSSSRVAAAREVAPSPSPSPSRAAAPQEQRRPGPGSPREPSRPRTAASRKKKAAPAEEPVRAEGASTADDPDVRLVAEVRAAPALLEGSAAGAAAEELARMRVERAALEQIVREQQELLRAARASPAPSVPQPPVAAAAAPAAPAPSQPDSARTPRQPTLPRMTDLAEYGGAPGVKLDEWLDALQRVAEYHSLSGEETVRYAAVHLRDAAYAWWRSQKEEQRAALLAGGGTPFASALRARFQPITTQEVAREKLDRLQQGQRSVNDYIAEFQQLTTQIGMDELGEKNALYAFRRGLRQDIALELRKADPATLREAIALAARVGGLTAGLPPARPAAALNQMGYEEGAASSLDERFHRLETTVLNALSGIGAKTQTQRGYDQENRGGRGAFGGRGRGGRFGGRGGIAPTVPGVAPEEVRRRLDARLCTRCGQEGHTSHACPNAISGN